MPFRDELAAAHARIAALERENAELRADVARLAGRAPIDQPLPEVEAFGASRWTPGRVLGWAPARKRLAYVGGLDDAPIVRVIDLGRAVVLELPLARDTRDMAIATGPIIAAQLGDGRLVAVPWQAPEGPTPALLLSARLLTPPTVDGPHLVCVTTDHVKHRIDRAGWRILGSAQVEPAAIAREFGDRKPYALEFEVRIGDHALSAWSTRVGVDGWALAGWLPGPPDHAYVALTRKLVGRPEMAIALVRLGPEPLPVVWLTELGRGDPFRFYAVDDLVLLQNFGLGEPDVTVAVDAATGREVFRIDGTFDEARFRGADGTVAAP